MASRSHNPRRVSVLVVLLGLLAFARPGAARPFAFNPSPKTGVLVEAGYETVTFEHTESPVSLDGLGLAALGYFSGSYGRYALMLGAGLHYAALSGDNDTTKLSVSVLSLTMEAAPSVILRRVYELGLLLSYDYGLVGSAELATQSEGSSSREITHSSRFTYGGRFLYQLRPRIAFGGDLGLLSGNFDVKPDKGTSSTAVTYSGLTLRGLFSYRIP